MSQRKQPSGPRPSRPIRPLLDAARAEAELARHGYVGLEHLLIALTRPEAPETAALLANYDITTERTRDAVRLVVASGRGDGPRFDAATLLATLGIDLDQVRGRVQAQFGADAIHDLYTSPAGWNLRPRGPLCDLGLSRQLKGVLDCALGHCWDTAPSRLPERLLHHALDSESHGLAAALDELDTSIGQLRADLTTQLRIAG